MFGILSGPTYGVKGKISDRGGKEMGGEGNGELCSLLPPLIFVHERPNRPRR